MMFSIDLLKAKNQGYVSSVLGKKTVGFKNLLNETGVTRKGDSVNISADGVKNKDGETRNMTNAEIAYLKGKYGKKVDDYNAQLRNFGLDYFDIEIEMFTELRDMGIITEREFEIATADFSRQIIQDKDGNIIDKEKWGKYSESQLDLDRTEMRLEVDHLENEYIGNPLAGIRYKLLAKYVVVTTKEGIVYAEELETEFKRLESVIDKLFEIDYEERKNPTMPFERGKGKTQSSEEAMSDNLIQRMKLMMMETDGLEIIKDKNLGEGATGGKSKEETNEEKLDSIEELSKLSE